MDEKQIGLVEALIFANGEPLASELIEQITSLTAEEIQVCVAEIRSGLLESASGLELVEVGGKLQFRTKAEFAESIRRLKAEKPRKLSAPAVETLAIIAYRQPIVKSDIEKLRGVDATPTLNTLLERNLVKIVGHQASVGTPALYGTTDEFLKVFGLKSLGELPTLRDLKELEDPGEVMSEA